MTAHLDSKPQRQWVTQRLAMIVVIGMVLTAAINLWASVPIVRSLAELSTDSKQVEIFGESRMQLVELYKLRRAHVEMQLSRCLQEKSAFLQRCVIHLGANTTTLTAVPEESLSAMDVPSEAQPGFMIWPDESHVMVFDGRQWWSAVLMLKPVKSLTEDITAWLSAHEHLSLVIERLTSSFVMTLVATAIGGVIVCLGLVMLLSRTMRRQYAALSDYIKTLANGVTKPIPAVLQNTGELSRLAGDVHTLSSELAKAQERVVEAERMSVWQTMARKVAHEIKNPLTPIGLVGEQLSAMALQVQDPQVREALSESGRVIAEETGSLNRMVREFTAFARLPKPQLQTVNLNDLIRDFIVRNQAIGSFHVEVIPFAEPAYAAVDSGMMHQILHNLWNNARLAKAPQEVQVRVSLQKNQSHWVIDFADDGPGIPEDLRHRMFDAYVTTRSTGDKEKGMGLGLTISRQIALDHGGSLTLYQTGVTGTTMRIELPQIHDQVVEEVTA